MGQSAVPRRDVVLAALGLATRAARTALVFLVLAGGLYMVCLVVSMQDLAYVLSAGGVPSVDRAHEMNARAGGLSTAGWVAFLVGTLMLRSWYRTTLRAAVLSGAVVTPSRGGFAVMRPYESLRMLDRAVDPATVPEPPPTPETAAHAGGYREPAAATVARSEIGKAPLMACWLLWLASFAIFLFRWLGTASWTGAKVLDSLANAGNVAVAALGCVIIVRMGARLTERVRRACPAS